MADDTTKPPEAEGAKPTVSDDANPAQGSGTPEQGQPNAAAAQQSTELSAEEIAEMRKAQVAYRELQSEFTRRSQENAALRGQVEQLSHFAESVLRKQQQESDPLVALKRQRAQAIATLDAEKVEALDDEIDRIRTERIQRTAREEAWRVAADNIRINEDLQRARQYDPNVTIQSLAEVQKQGIRADELAIIKAYREGKLPTMISAQQKAEEARKRQAALQQSMYEPNGRLGISPSGEAPPPIDPFAIAGLSPRARKELLAKSQQAKNGA